VIPASPAGRAATADDPRFSAYARSLDRGATGRPGSGRSHEIHKTCRRRAQTARSWP